MRTKALDMMILVVLLVSVFVLPAQPQQLPINYFTSASLAIPKPRLQHTFTYSASNASMFLLTGTTNLSSCTPTAETFQFQFNQINQSGTWTNTTSQITNTPLLMGAASVSVNNGTGILLFGGASNCTQPVNTMWYFDVVGSTWYAVTQIGMVPAATWGHRMAVWSNATGTTLFMLGGSSNVASLYSMDITNLRSTKIGSWNIVGAVGSSPVPRIQFSMSLAGSTLFLHGGKTPYTNFSSGLNCSAPMSDFWTLNVSAPTPSWTSRQFSNLALADSGHSSYSYNDQFVAVMGRCLRS